MKAHTGSTSEALWEHHLTCHVAVGLEFGLCF